MYAFSIYELTLSAAILSPFNPQSYQSWPADFSSLTAYIG